MAKYLVTLLSILLFFRPEIFSCLTSLETIQLICLLTTILLGLFLFKDKIAFKEKIVRKIDYLWLKVKYSLKFQRCKRKLSSWCQKNNAKTLTESLVDQLRNKVFLTFFLMVFSIISLSHYPQSMQNVKSIDTFLFQSVLYAMFLLTANKKILFIASTPYFVVAVLPYIMLGLDAVVNSNILEAYFQEQTYIFFNPIITYMPSVLHLVNLNNPSDIDMANTLFLFIGIPWLTLLCFTIAFSFTVRYFIRIFFATILNFIKLLSVQDKK
jgi:hypothetical protein